MADQKQKKMPKAIRISRKLPLSSEEIRMMSSADVTAGPERCTRRLTGCGPIHTC